MLRFEVLTLFPEIFSSFLDESLIKRAIEKGLLSVSLVNFRKHGLGNHLQVDDSPYGGGPGMILRIEPVDLTLEEQKNFHQSQGRETHTILVSPQGQPLTQKKAKELSHNNSVLTLVCGRYEGFDERIRTNLITDEISIGDFILSGGEIAASVIVDSVSRLIPGVLGDFQSAKNDSFFSNLLQYPQFTRPADFRGHKVPDILLSGNHAQIEKWRKEQSIIRTRKNRPDLLGDNSPTSNLS